MWQRIKNSFKLTFSNFGDFVLYLITPIIISVPFIILFIASIMRYKNPDTFPLLEMIAFFIYFFVLGYTFHGAIVHYVYQRGEGNKVKFLETIKTGFHKFFVFFASQFVAGLIAFIFSVIPLLSIFLFLDPISYAEPFEAIASLQLGIKIVMILMVLLSLVISIFFSVHYSLIPFLVIVDDEGVSSSRKKSYKLIKEKGLAWEIFGTFFLCVLIISVLNIIAVVLGEVSSIFIDGSDGEFVALSMVIGLFVFGLNIFITIVNMGIKNFLLYGFYRDIKENGDHNFPEENSGQ